MARANRTGVPGLALIKSGPHAGRYRLGFRYVCPVTREKKRISKLYPRELKTAAIKADARALVNDALTGTLARREAETQATAEKVTIAGLASEVIRYREAKGGSPATLLEFRSVLSGDEDSRRKGGGHIARHLGGLAPHELDSARLASFVDRLRADGLSPLTIRNVFKVLGAFVNIVRARQLDPQLTTNPLRDAFELGLELPSKKREKPIFLAQDEAERLLACPDVPDVRRTRYALAFLSGLRDGELAGLTWADVDLDAAGDEVLRVTKALAKIGGLQATKTTASERTVPLHPQIVPWLRTWRAEGWRGVVGRDPRSEDPVFARVVGRAGPAAKVSAWRPDSARRFRADLALAKVAAPEGIDFHATRRSLASWLEAARVPHELIERLLGHEPRSVLGRHYAAPDLGVLREALQRLGSRLAHGFASSRNRPD